MNAVQIAGEGIARVVGLDVADVESEAVVSEGGSESSGSLGRFVLTDEDGGHGRMVAAGAPLVASPGKGETTPTFAGWMLIA